MGEKKTITVCETDEKASAVIFGKLHCSFQFKVLMKLTGHPLFINPDTMDRKIMCFTCTYLLLHVIKCFKQKPKKGACPQICQKGAKPPCPGARGAKIDSFFQC